MISGAETIGQVMDWFIFDNPFSHFSSKNGKHSLLQLLNYKDVLRFFVLYESKFNIYGFRTVGETKTRHFSLLYDILLSK